MTTIGGLESFISAVLPAIGRPTSVRGLHCHLDLLLALAKNETRTADRIILLYKHLLLEITNIDNYSSSKALSNFNVSSHGGFPIVLVHLVEIGA
jgi:hypothetical protein